MPPFPTPLNPSQTVESIRGITESKLSRIGGRTPDRESIAERFSRIALAARACAEGMAAAATTYSLGSAAQ